MQSLSWRWVDAAVKKIVLQFYYHLASSTHWKCSIQTTKRLVLTLTSHQKLCRKCLSYRHAPSAPVYSSKPNPLSRRHVKTAQESRTPSKDLHRVLPLPAFLTCTDGGIEAHKVGLCRGLTRQPHESQSQDRALGAGCILRKVSIQTLHTRLRMYPPTYLPTYKQTNKQTWIQYNTIPHHNTAQYNILHRCMHAYQNIHKLLSITLHYINPYIKNEHTYKHTYTTLHQYIHYIHTSHYIALHFTEVHCIAWHHITSHYITLHHSTYITNNTKQYHAIQYIHTIAIHYSHGHRLRTLYFSKNQNPALRTWSKPNS